MNGEPATEVVEAPRGKPRSEVVLAELPYGEAADAALESEDSESRPVAPLGGFDEACGTVETRITSSPRGGGWGAGRKVPTATVPPAPWPPGDWSGGRGEE